MPIYTNNKDYICPNCGNNTFIEQETFLLTNKVITNTKENKYDKVPIGKKITCAKCNQIITGVDINE